MLRCLRLEYFPFTEALSHVLVEGTFNNFGESIDMTVHMWEENPNEKIVPPSTTDHAEYEAGRWPEFLPQLYEERPP